MKASEAARRESRRWGCCAFGVAAGLAVVAMPRVSRADVAPLVEVALVPPVSLFGWENPEKDVYGIDANIIHDRARNVYGAAVGMFASVDKDLWGVAFNIAGSTVDGKMRGLQISGFYNRTDGNFMGLQFGVLKNTLAGYRAYGAQLSVFKNESLADFSGLQFSGFVNETSGFKSSGIFIAGLTNWDDAEVTTGIEISLLNFKSGQFWGIQTGFLNVVDDNEKVKSTHGIDWVPYGDMTGLQIGVINIGGWVRGMQVGVFNYASTLTGLQVGAINIAPGKGSLTFFPGLNPGFATERDK